MMTLMTGTSSASPAPPAGRRTPRHWPAPYKISILEEYDQLDRAGKTALLKREHLRASLISQWRTQVYAAALDALSAQPGSQPARKIHVADALWEAFTETAANCEPAMRPERLLRAIMRFYAGYTDHLPARPQITAGSTAPGRPTAEETD
jgi:hypothetical protein